MDIKEKNRKQAAKILKQLVSGKGKAPKINLHLSYDKTTKSKAEKQKEAEDIKRNIFITVAKRLGVIY